MSTCISRHGEYSDHEPGDWCPRCGAFNEDAIVAERDRLRAAVERVRALSMSVADDPDVEGMTMRDHGAVDHALGVLAALDGPTEDTEPGDPS